MERGAAAEVHASVLIDEVIAALRPRGNGLYVDGTLGLGGHGAAILAASSPDGRVLGFDWDGEARALAAGRMAAFGERVEIVAESYVAIPRVLSERGLGRIDGLLLDLGVSSLQLDRAERGFSFRFDGPLDMRMDQRRAVTAADLLRDLGEDELADIFYHYGEERQARRIAARLVAERQSRPILTTGDLARLVGAAVPRRFHPRRIHVATRVFQALRIAVNRELDNLAAILRDGPGLLAPGGRMVVITFHSLEDRMVKQAFARSEGCSLPPSGSLEPDEQEVSANPRARSARLRVIERDV